MAASKEMALGNWEAAFAFIDEISTLKLIGNSENALQMLKW
jgi:hypothetical protein